MHLIPVRNRVRGLALFSIASRFLAGDSIGHLAWDYARKPTEIREEWLAERARRRGKRSPANSQGHGSNPVMGPAGRETTSAELSRGAHRGYSARPAGVSRKRKVRR